MKEIDLIPQDYRLRRQKLGELRRGLMVCALLASSLLGASVVLQNLSDQARRQTSSLSRQQQLLEQQSSQLQSLDEQIRQLSEQLDILNGFRGGQLAPELLMAIDRSLLPGSVWFAQLDFGRAGSLVDGSRAATQPGYFIMLPSADSRAAAKAWKIDTHMELHGFSHNYEKLAEFVSRLLKQPEISEVRVLRSDLREQQQWQVVSFELAVLINVAESKG